MPRAKRGYKARRRRNRVLRAISGYRGKRGTCYAIGSEALHHAWMHMYRHRRTRKREFRRLWVVRINAAARANGTTYSRLMHGLKNQGVDLNRKMLAEIAIHDPAGFRAITQTASA